MEDKSPKIMMKNNIESNNITVVSSGPNLIPESKKLTVDYSNVCQALQKDYQDCNKEYYSNRFLKQDFIERDICKKEWELYRHCMILQELQKKNIKL